MQHSFLNYLVLEYTQVKFIIGIHVLCTGFSKGGP